MQLGPEFAEALDGKTAYCDEDARLIKIRPPEQNNGIDASTDLLRSFHDFREEQGLLHNKNVSDTTGFELWYDHEELQFMYFTPSREREEHYRRQLDGHFRGCKIEDVRHRFLDVDAGEYVTGGEVWLRNHFFEPIRSPNGGVEEWNDPYLLLFSELDTRDETRTILQLLFRPAEPDWTRTTWENVDDYSAGMRDKRTSSRFFGLIKNQRDPTANETEYADTITRQAGRPAFYVNLRYIVVSPTSDKAVEHADNVATRLRLGYQEISGQTLDTSPCKSSDEVAELIRKVAAREPSYMPRKRGVWEDWKFAKFGDPTKKMIMTLPEIAGLTHFPKAKNVGLDAITWTDMPVDGSLPHNAKRFDRLDDDEREPQLQKWVVQQRQLLDELGLNLEEATFLMKGTPRDEELSEHILENPEQYAPNDSILSGNSSTK